MHKKPARKKTKSRRSDAQLREFEQRDLGDDVRASGVRPVLIGPKTPAALWIAQNIWSKKATAQALAEAAGITLQPIPLPVPDRAYVSQWKGLGLG